MLGLSLGLPLRQQSRALFPGAPVLPDLFLDLTNPNTALRLTTVRASNAWADDSAGNWSAFPPSIPRITDKGLLIEEPRINSIRNNSMQGAVPGTPGTAPNNWFFSGTGITIQLVGTGTERGIDYIEYRFFGTTGATFGSIGLELASVIAATVGQVWTDSAFISLVAGSMTNVTSFRVNVSEYLGGSFLSNNNGTGADIKGSLTSVLQRFTSVATLTQATTTFVVPSLLFTWSSGVAIDFTLRIGWPQLELGAFVTSPIRTTSAAVQRNADVVNAAGFGTWYNPAAGSLFADFTINNSAIAGTFPSPVTISDNTINNRIFHMRNGVTNHVAQVSDAGVAQMFLATAAIGNTAHKVALAYAANDFAAVGDGGSVLTDLGGTIPVVDRMFIGSGYAANFSLLNGCIRRVAYWGSRLTNAQLQAITA